MKTFFNMLGPMVNPSSPQRQMVGVYSLELARIYAYLYQTTDKEYAIIHSLDGYDEVSLTGSCKVVTRDSDRIIQPEELGFRAYNAEDLGGGNTVKDAMKIFMAVLENRATDAQKDVVMANAGLALKTCHPDKELPECMDMAKQSIESGSALKSFQSLMELNA